MKRFFVAMGLCTASILGCSEPPLAPDEIGLAGDTISGVVSDLSGRPIEGARVGVAADPTRTSSGEWSGWGRQTVTDAAGRYRISGLSSGGPFLVVARKDGNLQPCFADRHVTLVHRSELSIWNSVATAHARAGTRTVSGTVFETTSAGTVPVENARVNLAFLASDTHAYTETDGAGYYVLCGLPYGALHDVVAWKDGYAVTNVSIPAGTDPLVVDIELRQ